MIEAFIDNLKRSVSRGFKRLGIEVRRRKPSLKFNPDSFTENRREGVTKTVLSHQENSVFFGYHDKTPFNSDGTKILANSVAASPTDLKNECTRMELGYFEKKDGVFRSNFHKFAETTIWSWQQGCMLQWNPLQTGDQVYFNKIVNGDHGAVLYDLKKEKIIREFERPIYSISPKGDIASSINFRRVAEFRDGYGYKKFSSQKNFQNVPEDDGIFFIDLDSGKTELIVSIKDLANYSNHDVPHYINHVRYSPSGDKFLFFHITEGLGGKRIISFYLYDISTKSLELLEASRSVSHFCWRNEHEVFTSEIGQGQTHYFLYDLIQKRKKEVALTDIGDIHPMISPTNPDKVLLDTKPDINRNQHLFTFDLKKNDLEHLGKFYLPTEFEDAVRCDLHPRWDRQGKQISIDSVDHNLRSMTILQLN